MNKADIKKVRAVHGLIFSKEANKYVFIERYDNKVGIPGGFVDNTDKDLLHTFLREVYEEIRIKPETLDVKNKKLVIVERNKKFYACFTNIYLKTPLTLNQLKSFDSKEIKRILLLNKNQIKQYVNKFPYPLILQLKALKIIP